MNNFGTLYILPSANSITNIKNGSIKINDINNYESLKINFNQVLTIKCKTENYNSGDKNFNYFEMKLIDGTIIYTTLFGANNSILKASQRFLF